MEQSASIRYLALVPAGRYLLGFLLLSSSKDFQFSFGCPGWRFFNSPTIGNTCSLAASKSPNMMERHYNGGYYLIKTKPIDFGADKEKVVRTCSRCINFSVFDNWCLSWMSDKLDEKEKIELELTDDKIEKIQQWTDSRFENGANVFPNLKTAVEFKELFFKSRNDIGIYSLNFPETDTDLLISEFAKGNNTNEFNYNNGDFGLRKNLLKKTEERENTSEDFCGYDFVAVECNGSFHSFYCHDITKILVDKFGLKLNEYGLFDEVQNPDLIREYLNDNETGLEPVPWYIAKVKRVKEASR